MTAQKETIADQMINGAKAASARAAELAETRAARAKETYERVAADAEKITDYFETVATRSIGDVAKTNRNLIELAKGDAEAAMTSVREVLQSKTFADALGHHLAFVRGRIDARRALATEAYASFKKASEGAWKPRGALKAVEPSVNKAA